MSEKKPYIVDFVYTDNGQMFTTNALMTEDEHDDLYRVLGSYRDVGAIEQDAIYEPPVVTQDFDTVLAEIIDALKDEVTDGDDKSTCQGCGHVWPDVMLITPIEDLYQRVSPGEIMPSGECPACRALCHPVKE